MQKQVAVVNAAPKEAQWYDVGIVKVTNMVVSHYYVPLDDNALDVRTPSLLSYKSLIIN